MKLIYLIHVIDKNHTTSMMIMWHRLRLRPLSKLVTIDRCKHWCIWYNIRSLCWSILSNECVNESIFGDPPFFICPKDIIEEVSVIKLDVESSISQVHAKIIGIYWFIFILVNVFPKVIGIIEWKRWLLGSLKIELVGNITSQFKDLL